MTGKQLRFIRRTTCNSERITVKKFYEEKIGISYYTMGLNAEKMYEIPESFVTKLRNAGLLKEEK